MRKCTLKFNLLEKKSEGFAAEEHLKKINDLISKLINYLLIVKIKIFANLILSILNKSIFC